MILPPHIVQSLPLRRFLNMRTYLRKAYRVRLSIVSSIRSDNRYITLVEELQSPFDSHRIKHLQAEVERKQKSLHEVNEIIEKLKRPFCIVLNDLNAILSPKQKAFVLGNTTQWLDKIAPDWRNNSMFDLLFIHMCERERYNEDGLPPLFWVCSQTIKSLPREKVREFVEMLKAENAAQKEEKEKEIQRSKRPHLYLVKS